MAAVFTLSPHQSRTLPRRLRWPRMAPSLGGSGAGSCSPGAKEQLGAARPFHLRASRARKRAVFESGPRCAARATAGLRSRNQDPSCLRSRLRLRSWPRSGLVVWKREPRSARAARLVFPRPGGEGRRQARLRQRGERPTKGPRRARRGLWLRRPRSRPRRRRWRCCGSGWLWWSGRPWPGSFWAPQCCSSPCAGWSGGWRSGRGT